MPVHGVGRYGSGLPRRKRRRAVIIAGCHGVHGAADVSADARATIILKSSIFRISTVQYRQTILIDAFVTALGKSGRESVSQNSLNFDDFFKVG